MLFLIDLSIRILLFIFVGEADAFDLSATTNFSLNYWLVEWEKLEALEAQLRPFERFAMEGKAGCISSWMCL
jgi:hypothetical protein